ncbi:MAG: TIGR02710 family CRISPR-associated CARF protein [Bacillota bacterium]
MGPVRPSRRQREYATRGARTRAISDLVPGRGAGPFGVSGGRPGNLDFLATLEEASDKGRKIGRLHVVDLIANAGRRAAEGAYDDAVARLYRALEMRAQVALAERGINTGDVKPEEIPAVIREEMTARHRGSDGKIRLPLHASYQLLAALGDPIGLAYMGEKRAPALLEARNNSILAHGRRPVTPEIYRGMLEIALALTEVKEDELPRMPSLTWEA